MVNLKLDIDKAKQQTNQVIEGLQENLELITANKVLSNAKFKQIEDSIQFTELWRLQKQMRIVWQEHLKFPSLPQK